MFKEMLVIQVKRVVDTKIVPEKMEGQGGGRHKGSCVN
jgi:hypothetical protein